MWGTARASVPKRAGGDARNIGRLAPRRHRAGPPRPARRAAARWARAGRKPPGGAAGSPLPSPPRPMTSADTARRSRQDLLDLQDSLRDRVHETDDDQLAAVLETAAEALGGLAEAFADFAEGDEAAWDA